MLSTEQNTFCTQNRVANVLQKEPATPQLFFARCFIFNIPDLTVYETGIFKPVLEEGLGCARLNPSLRCVSWGLGQCFRKGSALIRTQCTR